MHILMRKREHANCTRLLASSAAIVQRHNASAGEESCKRKPANALQIQPEVLSRDYQFFQVFCDH